MLVRQTYEQGGVVLQCAHTQYDVRIQNGVFCRSVHIFKKVFMISHEQEVTAHTCHSG